MKAVQQQKKVLSRSLCRWPFWGASKYSHKKQTGESTKWDEHAKNVNVHSNEPAKSTSYAKTNKQKLISVFSDGSWFN